MARRRLPRNGIELVTSGVDEGARNHAIARIAGLLFRRSARAETVAAELVACFNAVKCRPPLGAEELKRTIDSIAAKEMQPPRNPSMSVEDFASRGPPATRRPATGGTGSPRPRTAPPRKNLFNACVALRDHPDSPAGSPMTSSAAAPMSAGRCPGTSARTAMDRVRRPRGHRMVAERERRHPGRIRHRREAVQAVAYENRFHPVLEYLEGLKWDGTERLSGWLTTYLGVPQSPLADAIGRKFLISAVARVMSPGCKVDHVLILEGLQGTLKSKALRALVGDDWFTDQIADLGTKDSCQDLRGVWVIELSELTPSAPAKSSRSRLISPPGRPLPAELWPPLDRRPATVRVHRHHQRARVPERHHRQPPLLARDVHQARPRALARDRDQLWAEAVAAYHAGETWWLDDDELRRAAEAEQEARRIDDPWEAIIADWLDNPTKQPDRDGYRAPSSSTTAASPSPRSSSTPSRKPAERQTKGDQMRVGTVLRLLGWTKTHTVTGKVWLPQSEVVSRNRHREAKR